MSSDSSQSAGPPSSTNRNPPPPSRLLTRPALASFTSPSFPAPTPPSVNRFRGGFSVERIYEFEAPQFYDFTKQSDPERGHLDEHWFGIIIHVVISFFKNLSDSRKRTPSSPDFHFIARTSSSATAHRPKSASGKLCHKGNFSGRYKWIIISVFINIFSNGGLSFMNTPVGRGQTFTIPSSVGGTDIRSSVSYNPRAALKRSATTENITNTLLNSDSSDPPSTIIRSAQKRFREFGSDERKIISGFMSTPLLVIKTPGTVSRKELPRSPLQKVTKKSNLGLFLNEPNEGASLLVKETSSIDDFGSVKSNETILIEETFKESSKITSSNTNSSFLKDASYSSYGKGNSSFVNVAKSEKEHENFQAGVKARLLEERERIESQAALQTRKIQKLKAGPTNLPVKSTKPLTVPKGFQLGCDGRAQLKKLQSKPQTIQKPSKPPISQKFTPTIPKSPMFASKLRVSTTVKSENDSNTGNTTNAATNHHNPVNKNIDLRRKLEFQPISKLKTSNVTIPKSPKLSSIHRNRVLNKN